MDKNYQNTEKVVKKNNVSNEDKTKLVENKKKEKKVENYEEDYYQLKWLVP